MAKELTDRQILLIREYRLNNTYSREKTAKIVGVSVSSVAKYEQMSENDIKKLVKTKPDILPSTPESHLFTKPRGVRK